jgi:hypothetical protein
MLTYINTMLEDKLQPARWNRIFKRGQHARRIHICKRFLLAAMSSLARYLPPGEKRGEKTSGQNWN